MSGSQQESKTGRPSEYSPETVTTICNRIAAGESLRKICESDEMPGKSTVMEWLAAHESFRTIYAQAREVQADHMAEEILDIADDTTSDTDYGDAGPKPNTEWISRSKLRVDARFKLMSLLAPKKYGTKHVDVTSDGQAITWHEERNYDSDQKAD